MRRGCRLGGNSATLCHVRSVGRPHGGCRLNVGKRRRFTSGAGTHMPFGRFSCWMACFVVLTLGCGSDPDSPTPVRGKVYFKGTPLKRGTIVFSPDERRGGRGDLARAEIQPDGSFSLKTGDREGAVAGWHRVTIVAV